MKMMTKVFFLGVVGLSFAGCAQPDDAKVMITDSGKQQTGVTLPGTPKTSRETYERSKNSNPNAGMMNNKDYTGAGR